MKGKTNHGLPLHTMVYYVYSEIKRKKLLMYTTT